MRQDVKHFILTCPVCQNLKTAKNIVKAHPFTTSSERPMKVLNIDFVGMNIYWSLFAPIPAGLNYSFARMPLLSPPPVPSSRILDATELSINYVQTAAWLS
jgi:hypothetical protein